MLPTDAKARKAIPVWSGCIAYFPNALVAIAGLSQRANDQHNPGEPLHWAMEKSTDEQDAGMRHAIEPLLIGASEYDADGTAHKVKKAWRACAELERWLRAGNAPYQEPTVLAEYPIKQSEPIVLAAGASPFCYYCGDLSAEAAPTRCSVPNNHAKPRISVPRCTATDRGVRCVLSDGHPGNHKPPPRVCFDCGVDLEEQGHAAGCLRKNR